MYYLNLFFVSSIFGFIIETILKTLFFHSMNNGIMFSPWIFVYGFGIVIIVFISDYIFTKFNISRLKKNVLIFFVVSILLTFLEFVGGNLIEILFNKVYWNYDDLLFNFGYYIALEISILWGICSIIYIHFIEPIFNKVIKKIPKIITILILIIFLIDLILTIIFQLT